MDQVVDYIDYNFGQESSTDKTIYLQDVVVEAYKQRQVQRQRTRDFVKIANDIYIARHNKFNPQSNLAS